MIFEELDTIFEVEKEERTKTLGVILNNIHLQPQPNSDSPAREVPAAKIERAYIEVPGLRPETKDVLKQLQSNIALLEDQCGRLGFLLSEIRTVIRR